MTTLICGMFWLVFLCVRLRRSPGHVHPLLRSPRWGRFRGDPDGRVSLMWRGVSVCSGAVALQISCFSEAERIYMLAKDTSISSKTLTSLVIPEIQVRPPPVLSWFPLGTGWPTASSGPSELTEPTSKKDPAPFQKVNLVSDMDLSHTVKHIQPLSLVVLMVLVTESPESEYIIWPIKNTF